MHIRDSKFEVKEWIVGSNNTFRADFTVDQTLNKFNAKFSE